MSRNSYLLGVSFFALAACQPAEEAADALEAETPPVVAEDVSVEETVEPTEVVVEATEAEVEETAEDAHDDDHDHAEDEAHADHDDHDHDAHEDHDHDEHDHDEHDHEGEEHSDHDHDHDHAGGEAHVHGLSDLAVSLDGDTVSVSVEGALANFDLDESIRTLSDTTPYESSLVALQGGECTQDEAAVSIRPIGDHGNLTVDLTYTCAAIDTLTGVDVIGFQTFAGFEEVNAVLLTDTGQTAETLTASDTVLDLP